MSFFTAIGISLLLVSAFLSFSIEQLKHQDELLRIKTLGLATLSAKLNSYERMCQEVLRNLCYEALWEVSGKAHEYECDHERIRAAESLVLESLEKFRIATDEFVTFSKPWKVDLLPAENGYVMVRCHSDSTIVVSNSFACVWKTPSLQTFVDCRFFLLQEKMNEFLSKLDYMQGLWGKLEHSRAYSSALSGKVRLSKTDVCLLFEHAWSMLELEVFGTTSTPIPHFTAVDSYLLRLDSMAETVASNLPPAEKARLVMRSLSELESSLKNLPFAVTTELLSSIIRLKERLATENENALQEILERRSSGTKTKTFRLTDAGLKEVEREMPALENCTLLDLYEYLSALKEELELLYVGGLHTPNESNYGLSVSRKLRVREIRFRREDPLGLLGCKQATPIYLPFLKSTVWWGQYTVEIELEEAVETVIDSKNPTIPRKFPFPSHYPLRYSYRIPRGTFRTRVVVVSPMYFEIE